VRIVGALPPPSLRCRPQRVSLLWLCLLDISYEGSVFFSSVLFFLFDCGCLCSLHRKALISLFLAASFNLFTVFFFLVVLLHMCVHSVAANVFLLSALFFVFFFSPVTFALDFCHPHFVFCV
jgi:hypothetical protein